MNSPDTSVVIGPRDYAVAEKLVVGRHTHNVELHVNGGELYVGDNDSTSSILFVGQYSDATGKGKKPENR